MEHTMLLVGAGPGLGLSVAKRFGAEGFQIALVARNPTKMEFMLKALRDAGVTAEGFLADYHDSEALDRAMDDAIARFDFIDTVEMEFIVRSKSSGGMHDSLESRKRMANAGVIDLDSAELMNWIESVMQPTIQIVNKMLPRMQEHRQDSVSGFLCPMGWSGIWPGEGEACNELPYHILRKITPAIAFAAQIKYLEFLNAQMCFDNIYAVANMLALWIKPGTPHDPDRIADHMYRNIYLPRQTDPLLRRKVIETFPEDIRKPSDLVRY